MNLKWLAPLFGHIGKILSFSFVCGLLYSRRTDTAVLKFSIAVTWEEGKGHCVLHRFFASGNWGDDFEIFSGSFILCHIVVDRMTHKCNLTWNYISEEAHDGASGIITATTCLVSLATTLPLNAELWIISLCSVLCLFIQRLAIHIGRFELHWAALSSSNLGDSYVCVCVCFY